MLISPLLFIVLLLLGTALTFLVAARWPRAVYPTALATLGLGLLLWLLQGQNIPYTFSLEDRSDNLSSPLWQWDINETIWLLSGTLLLMSFSLLLFRMGQSSRPVDRQDQYRWQLTRAEWQPILILALVSAGLSAIWSSALATLMMSWTLLAVFWALYLLTTWDQSKDLSSVSHRLFWMLVPLLFTGIAAAIKPLGSDLLDMDSWSPAAVSAILLAVMAQMGIIPFIGWRPRSDRWLPADGPVLYLVPPLVGAGLLVRLSSTVQLETGIILLLTVFGLISILSGVHRAWLDLRTTARLPADLALALSGLAFLAAIWTRTEALLSGVHLLVFSLTVLFLLETLRLSRRRWWRGLAPALALMALSGIPFTAGFITLTSIYTVWLANGLWILVLALALLLLPMISAVLIFIRDHIDQKSAPKQQTRSITSDIALLLPATGLIMLGGLSWADIHFAAWLTILVTAGGALLLARYVGEVQEVITTVDSALSPDRLPLGRFGVAAKKALRQIVFSLGEAAFILEADRGLLWLTAFLAILLFAFSS